jgi:SAM-dependent MidA family methyltransferase
MGSLAHKIQDQIIESGGWVGFDVFMNLALYAPGLGYYCGPREPFGPQGDFETAPMIGPWLAQAIWQWSQAMQGGLDFRVREFGGGRGDLAAGLMQTAARNNGKVSIEMIELSAGAQVLQRERLAGAGHVSWRAELQPQFSGLVIANELLDAMPVKCFEWQGGDQVLEWGVGVDSTQAQDPKFIWVARPAAEPLRSHVTRRARAAADRGLPWAIGYRGEACLWTAPWLQALSHSMTSGAVLLIDYGFCESELDQPGRVSGTLCAHSRHRRIDSFEALLGQAGEQDLTAHVNFSAIAFQAQQAGFAVDGFVTQARYLMNAGVLGFAQEALAHAGNERERIAISQSLQRLLTESEMGEVFKVMLLTKGLSDTVREDLYRQGFAGGDRLASL